MEKVDKLEKDKQINIKIYPIYKMLSWDLLFYYAIIFLFLTDVKGISPAYVLLAESFYTIFKFILQIPLTILIDKIGKRKSLILGNILVTLNVLMLIFSTDLFGVIFAYFLSAFGYVLKGTCESNMLYDSIPRSDKRREIFSKIDGKGTSYHYYVDAISAIVSGFLFAVNGYIPMVFSLLICILATYLSSRYKDVEIEEPKKEKISAIKEVKEYLKNLKYSFQYMAKSDRLRSLLLFAAIFGSILSVLTTLRSSILKDLGIPSQYFGILFAILTPLSGIGARNQEKFHNRLRNKTLALFSIGTLTCCIIIGFIAKTNLPIGWIMLVIVLLYAIQYIIKGPYYVLIDRYLRSFTTTGIRVKIAAMKDFISSIFRTGVNLLGAFLLGITNTANTFIIIGCLAMAILVVLLDYMRTRVGLKPEEYRQGEIEIKEVR